MEYLVFTRKIGGKRFIVSSMGVSGAEETENGVMLLTEEFSSVLVTESIEEVYNTLNGLEPWQGDYLNGRDV